MELGYLISFIAVMAGATFVTRALPFWLFRDQQHPVVLFLGKYLPPAVMTLLVMYCLKDVQWTAGTHGLPEMIALCTVVIAHLSVKNALVSIFCGTGIYMAIVQEVIALPF